MSDFTYPRARSSTVLLALMVLVAGLVLAASASAQWGRQTSGTALCYVYSADEDGVRLELSRETVVYSVGYFDDDDDQGTTYAVEVGLKASRSVSDYGGVPFVIGGGYYRLDPDDAQLSTSDDFALWAGVGEFDHTRKGLFYQYRYIFSGPLKGSEGCIGWAF